MNVNCLDISNYSGPITAQNVADWKAGGIEMVIVGLQFPNPPYPKGVAEQQLWTLVNGGMRVECYAESQSIKYAWGFVRQFQPYIERIWVAAEEEHVDEEWLDSELAFIDSLGLPKRAGIYTGAWWWQWQPFRTSYADRPIWLADYDGYLTPIDNWPYVTIWQHTGSTSFKGVDMVDLNEHFELTDFVEEPMTAEERISALEGQVNDLITVMYGRTWEDRDQEAADEAIERGGLIHFPGAVTGLATQLSLHQAFHAPKVVPEGMEGPNKFDNDPTT